MGPLCGRSRNVCCEAGSGLRNLGGSERKIAEDLEGAAGTGKRPEPGMVAGAGFEPATFGL